MVHVPKPPLQSQPVKEGLRPGTPSQAQLTIELLQVRFHQLVR